ncbi:TRM11 family SAM-dependent methyltransferase [Palaeococcus ferrophilus]|uniref:TRM11 family SAM-dependent methyltransferase n=1 Tax=Palaeococcus ferrophilus TaxID=83868 RepID=UPI00064E6B43|nr:methyltransferase domain-containing protein [Palaeococcus ferrophilus]
MEYAVIFGKNPELSEAEFRAFARRFGIRFSELERSREWLVFEGPKKVEHLFHRLGGSLKLVRLVDGIEELEYSKLFTVSFYGKDDWKLWRKLGSDVKRHFRESGPAKFFKPRNVYAMPAELILKGFPEVRDVVFIFGRREWIGETVRVADPFELKKLDVERPRQRAILSIPPRLARIMVNLSEVREGKALDPFCGVGTVIQELLLQGFDAYGSDINPSIVNAAKENVAWLKKEFRVKRSAHLEVCDAKKLHRCFRGRFDLIVSEPYLGKPLRKKPTRGEAVEMARKLDSFYFPVFESFSRVMKRNGRVVFVFPAYRLSDGSIYRRERGWLRRLDFEVLGRYLDFEERHRVVRDIHVLRYRG